MIVVAWSLIVQSPFRSSQDRAIDVTEPVTVPSGLGVVLSVRDPGSNSVIDETDTEHSSMIVGDPFFLRVDLTQADGRC